MLIIENCNFSDNQGRLIDVPAGYDVMMKGNRIVCNGGVIHVRDALPVKQGSLLKDLGVGIASGLATSILTGK